MSDSTLLVELGERAYAALHFEEMMSNDNRRMRLLLHGRISASRIRNLFSDGEEVKNEQHDDLPGVQVSAAQLDEAVPGVPGSSGNPDVV